MKTLFLAAALSGSVFAGMAGTAAVAQRGGGMMASADANGDGIITHEEFAAQAAQRFQRMDANNDGKLSGDELRGRMAERAQGGVITKAQFMADSDERFQKMDANHDGRITQDEIQAMMQTFRDRREQTGQPAGDRNMASPPPGAPRGEERLERIDTNHDGRISREEMRAASDRRFDKMDTNHDGFIDQAEMDAGRPPMRGGDMPPPPPGAGAPDRDAGQ